MAGCAGPTFDSRSASSVASLSEADSALASASSATCVLRVRATASRGSPPPYVAAAPLPRLYSFSTSASSCVFLSPPCTSRPHALHVTPQLTFPPHVRWARSRYL